MKTAKYVATGGIVAALYIVLTYLTTIFGFSSGLIQFRLSEALCILPCFTPAAIPGLFVGCLISNILSGAIIWDVVFGSIATLIGALGTYVLRRRRLLASLPPILANAAILPPILVWGYGIEAAYILVLFSIIITETISAGVVGQILYFPLSKNPKIFR